jgi:hypothetical protein
MKILHLSYQHIDLQKWDDCIKRSAQPLIYAQSFYLNQMSKHWGALVANDYETVMPLTFKKKWGIAYLYQPAFVGQMGIFGNDANNPTIVKSFVEAALTHYRLIEIPLNYSNTIATDLLKHTVQKNNFILSLNDDYDRIAKNFSGSHAKNIKRSHHFLLNYQIENNPASIIQLFSELYSDRALVYEERDYKNFELLCHQLSDKGQLIVRKVMNEEGQTIAGIILLKDEYRLYNVMSCVTAAGRKKEANYLLFQQLIKEFCNQPLLLDFEGSDVAGIAHFYMGFGASNECYPFVAINRLPALVKLLKK